jgi:hypothetical protein
MNPIKPVPHTHAPKEIIKKLVPIADVKTGMYVCELDRPWIETPFLMQGFQVFCNEEIEQLARYCKFIYIDELRSANHIDNRVGPLKPIQELFPNVKLKPYANTTTWEKEIPNAQKAISRLATTTSEIMDSVRNDDAAGSGAVVDHLVGLGHQRIAHIHAGSVGGSRGRRRGYEVAMTRHGLAAHIRSVRGAFTERGGQEAMGSIIETGVLPTAVFVANDFAALGALEALDAAGLRVPQDVSVVGYDDITSSHSSRVALTTVAQPSVEMGQTAVNLLIERAQAGRTEARHIVLPPRLVVRGTTAPPLS